MPSLTETAHPAEFILSEANGQRSRENVTILAGNAVKPGDVLGKITASGKYKVVTVAAADGSQNGVAIAMYPVASGAADVVTAVIARDAEVNGNLLTYGADVDTPTEITAVATSLATVGIIVRN